MKSHGKRLLVVLGVVLIASVGRAQPVTTTPLLTFSGHTLFVSSVAYSPDGTKVLTGSGDATAKLWDAATGSELRTLSGHTLMVTSVAFSPDGTKVLTGSQDYTAKLWDAATGSVLRTFSGHAGYVNSVAYSPDGTKVLTGSEDMTAKLWDAATGAEIRTVSPYASVVLSVAYSPDGTGFLTGAYDGTARLWDAATGSHLRTFSGHTGWVYSVAFSPDGTKVLTGSADWTAKLWDASNGSLIRTFSGHTGDIRTVAYSPDGTKVLTASWDETAKLWDASNGSLLRTFSGHNADVNSVAFSPDGTKVLTGSDDGTARLWAVQPSLPPPRLQSAALSDLDGNGTDPGDQLVLGLDRSVVVTTSVLRASHFYPAVAGDSLGGAGFAVGPNRYNSQQIVLTLGAGVHLTAAGQFSIGTLTPNSPSGIDFATSLPVGAIVSLDGISAINGGVPGADDSGIDIQLTMVGQTATVGTAGGTVAVAVSPDAAYTRHELAIPAGALTAPTQFTLRPPVENLGVIGAVQIESNPPDVQFTTPATIRLEYRASDIDRERGQLESEMRVHRLVEDPPGRYQYRRVVAPQTLNMAQRLVSIQVASLNPPTLSGGAVPPKGVEPRRLQLGSVTVFAGLPIETVDERTVVMKPGTGGMIRSQGSVVLTAGPRGAYPLHRIEFPGYEVAAATDPARLVVTIRMATLAERSSESGGQSFPAQSGAVFAVTITDATSQPVKFTSPVVLTVQFKDRPDPTQTDVVRFNGSRETAYAMQLVCDTQAGEAVNFAFVRAEPQSVNTTQGTVTVQNLVGLTGEDGKGTWGSVARTFSLRAARWQLYR